jgi:hypothetical protein
LRAKLPAVSWAFFGLIVIAPIIYALSLGIFIGSEAVFLNLPDGSGWRTPDGSGWYTLQCRYLYPTGVRRRLNPKIMAPSPEEAAKGLCPAFGKSKFDLGDPTIQPPS